MGAEPWGVMAIESMISDSLGAVFPQAEIWKEQIDEGFSRPAFFIQRIEGVFDQEIGNRYHETNFYMVSYFSDKPKQDLNADIWESVDKMRAVLKTISCDGETIYGRDINYRIEKGVLQFFVKYKRYLRESRTEETRMQKLEIETEME